MSWNDLTWASFVNCDAFPSPNDIRKIAGGSGSFNAGAVSVETIDSALVGAGIRFKLSPGFLCGEACGLSADNPDADYTGIDFCILHWSGDLPTTSIYENGVLVYDSGGFVYLGEYFKIVINASGQIEYYHSDTLMYTSTNAPSFPLFADASLCLVGVRVTDAQIDVGLAAAVDHLLMMGV